MRFLAFVGWAALFTLGCAEGSAVDLAAGGYGGDFTGAGGYGGDDPSVTTTTSTTTTSGVGGMGAGGMGTGGVPNECDFAATNTCQTAQVLSPVSGDDGSSVGATGTKSAWFHVHVQETNSSIFEKDLSYTVTLQSPPGMAYDLVVYEGPQDGNVNCNATPKHGQGAGSVQTVSNGWDDDQGIGGEDDSVWLAIEVFYVSGDDCFTPWVLTVQGGT